MKAKKSFGQNWLRDEETLDLIVASSDLTLVDTVLEVGPGLGTLTQKLVQKAGKVVAVEADHELIPQLEREFGVQANSNQRPGLKATPRPGLELVVGDILKFDLTKLPKKYKVVANIPYNITSKLIRFFLESTNPPQSLTLLVQKEVAERIAARPGQMSILAISVQFYCKVELAQIVERTKFHPAPKVDSQIINLEKLSQPALNVEVDKFFRLVKIGFSQKRKKLRNSLGAGLHLKPDRVDEMLQSAKLGSDVRAQELSLQDWDNLYRAWSSTS